MRVGNADDCDRLVPSCSLCDKFSRRCIYETLSKTPLTRQYLTEVEEELTRTKALLSELLPGTSRDIANGERFIYPEQDRTGDRGLTSEIPNREGSSGQPERAYVPHSNIGSETIPAPEVPSQPSLGVFSASSSNSGQLYDYSDRSQTGVSHRANRRSQDAVMSMETPPSAGNVNFEWDERTEDQGGDGFVDGMAILPSRSNDGGYLGIASGAALLRMTNSQSGGERLDMPEPGRPFETASSHQSPSVPFALSSLSQLEPFVDAYFSLYHCSYPIIHEATFRAQFMEVIPRPTSNTWQVLLYVVAALGAFTAAVTPTDVDLALFKAAKARLTIDVLETGSLILVQALTLSSNYLQKRNKPNSGYNYLGLARRTAMGIGLHKEFPTSKASPLAMEMRRRVWYCLYIFDVGAIITFSRPLEFPEQGIETRLPLNIHESGITASTQAAPSPVTETTVYTHLRAQAMFHLKTNLIYTKITSTSFPSAAELIELDDRLIGDWLASLPSFFNEGAIQAPKFALCHSILRWRYRNLRILMYRPFLVGKWMLNSDQGPDGLREKDDTHVELAIQRCFDAARESVELISSFWAQHQKTTMACWYGVYFLFQAILIPVICLRNNPSDPAAHGWREQIFQAINTLESMAPLNANAERFLRVIQSLCGCYLYPRSNGWEGPIQESPETQIANLYPLMWPTLEMAQLDGVDSALQQSVISDFMHQVTGLQ
ncbi:hypothetical protein RU639_005964 [Aspergillus parasiticus]